MRSKAFSRLGGASAIVLSIAAAGSFASAHAAPGAQSRYTRLDNCRVTRSSTEDVGFRQTRCAGLSAYTLETNTSDGRDDLAIVLPNRRRQGLNLAGNVGSGFGTLGATAEWRVRGGRPRAVIARFDVAEDPNRPTRKTSYLVVATVSPTGACVIGRVGPGRTQNASARRLADAGGRCLQAQH